MIISGSSGSGKTYILFKLIPSDLLDFNNLIIYTSTIDQPYYQFLKHLNNYSKDLINQLFILYENNQDVNKMNIDDIFNLIQPTQTNISILITNKVDEISIDKIDSSRKNLIIFDDCVNDKNQRSKRLFYSRQT